MEDGKRKELSRVLGGLEALKELDRLSERDQMLQKNRYAHRFQELKKAVILPTLREFMVDLDRKGHLTRLWEKAPEKVRLDVQIQTRVPKRGAIEFSLSKADPSKLRVDYGWATGDSRFQEELYNLERVEAGFVADRILHLLKGLL